MYCACKNGGMYRGGEEGGQEGTGSLNMVSPCIMINLDNIIF